MASEFDNEMPTPPAAGEETAVEQVVGAMDAADLTDVREMGEVIPAGTYHFRLDKYNTGWSEPRDSTKNGYISGEETLGKQPWFQLFWKAQVEPHVGRVFTDFCPFVNQETFKAARQGNPVARQILQDRLWKLKSIMSASGMKPSGSFDAIAFLDSHPEVKIVTGIGENKQTKEQQNRAVKYLPLMRG